MFISILSAMDDVRESILSALSDVSGMDVCSEDIRDSPVSDIGSSVGFQAAKKWSCSPHEAASIICSKMPGKGYILETSSEGGYVNIRLNRQKVAQYLLFQEKTHKHFSGKIVLEHTSVNPTGPIHVGRIRNTIIGDSLSRILRFVGHDVETRYFVNDIGRQIAMITLALEKGMAADESLSKRYLGYSSRSDFRLFFTYVSANRLAESDPAFSQKISELIRDAESGKAGGLQKLKSTAKSGLEGQLETYRRLGVSFDAFDFESEAIEDGSVTDVLESARQSPFYVKSDIGEGLDLSALGIKKRTGMSVLARSDGTSVYLLRDLAYHLKKYAMGDRLINVLGEDHKLQARELSAILTGVLGVKTPPETVHFSFVNFKGVKFSTRSGEIATVDELLDEAITKAAEESEKRGICNSDTANEIAMAAVKFHIVKTSPNKQISFSFEDALNFDGETGPYVQYAHARSATLLEKSGVDTSSIVDCDLNIDDPAEWELIMALLDFENQAERASKQLRPDFIANYLIALSQSYGRFYISCPVLKSNPNIMKRRLLLVKKLKDTLSTGLNLLGIKSPDRM